MLTVQFTTNAKGGAITPPRRCSLSAAKLKVDEAKLARWGWVHANPDLARREQLASTSTYQVTPIVPGPRQVRSGGLGIESPFMPPKNDLLVWTMLSEALSNTKAAWLGKGKDASGVARNGLSLGARVGTLGSAASAAATEPVATEPALCSVVRSRSQRLAHRQPQAASKSQHQGGANSRRPSGAQEALSRRAGPSAGTLGRPQNQ